MKNKYIIVAVSALLAMSSCKVTDLTATDGMTDGTYWKTPKDLELYANNFYSMLGGATSSGDVNTDVRISKNINTFFSGAYVIPDEDSGNWSFTTIRNANYFMNRYQTVKGDPLAINHYVAEVRFFRALEYWNKVKRFGDFPYYDRDLVETDEELIYEGRNSRDFVVGKIIEDLEFACNNLYPKSKVPTARLYNFVAYTQLARVCLYEGTRAKYAGDNRFNADDLITKAKVAAEYVMTNGGYNIVTDAGSFAQQVSPEYPLNYQALFTQLSPIHSNQECILSHEYKLNLSTHNVTRELEEPGTGLSKAMMNQYLYLDGTPFDPTKDATLDQELENRDRRLLQSIDNQYLPYKFRDGANVLNLLPIISGSMPTGYNFMKMHSTDPNQWIANNCSTQWFVYRYAEILLIYAEAKAELGTITQTDINNTINVLRSRGGVAALNMGAIATDPNWLDYGYPISDLLHEIRRERSVELLGEGFRYDDIMRWRAGKLLENPLVVYGRTVTDQVIAQYPGVFNVDGSGGIALVTYGDKRYIRMYTNLEGGYKWNDRMYLYPIPKNQITLNPNLKPQNPGW